MAIILRLTYQIPHLGLKGLLRTFGAFLVFSAPNYSTIQKRCKEINLLDWLPQKTLKNDLIRSVDASGIKLDNYSDWKRHKWQDKAKKRRGWIKMHIIVDTRFRRYIFSKLREMVTNLFVITTIKSEEKEKI